MSQSVAREGVVWIALIALTLVGYFGAEPAHGELAYVALGAGLVKFFLIFYEFMEMRLAHRGWLAAMGCLVFLFSAAVGFAISGGS